MHTGHFGYTGYSKRRVGTISNIETISGIETVSDIDTLSDGKKKLFVFCSLPLPMPNNCLPLPMPNNSGRLCREPAVLWAY